ncbi:putative leader peptide [Saccharopolyspora gregorii]
MPGSELVRRLQVDLLRVTSAICPAPLA